jgi:NAD-dependent deacetylase sirtuin 5
MAAFKELLKSSKNIIAVAGAGLSVASGIPTFRGAGGMWRKYDAMTLATPEAFEENPGLVWQFYHYRREKALAALPNKAHMALALFSLDSIRREIAPESTFTLITQNVDGLSQISLNRVSEFATGSDLSQANNPDRQPPLIEMHGRLFDLLCNSETCGHVEHNRNSPICSSLGGTEQLVEQGVLDPEVPVDQLPRCPECNALARPGVVWFGEAPHHLELIDDLVKKADLCIVVGTSSTVYPAASYAPSVQKHGGKVAVFNVERSEGDERANYLFTGPCEDLLPEALGVKDNVESL